MGQSRRRSASAKAASAGLAGLAGSVESVRCGHARRDPLRSARASMTVRISHALVEIPSDEAISSTRVFTDWGSLRVIRETGSSSGKSLASPSDSGSGSSKVGSASAVCTETTNSGSWPTMRSSTEDGARSALMVPAASDNARRRARRVEDSMAVPRRSATCRVGSSARADAFATPTRTDSKYGERSMTPL